jgi:hypothetical protein
MTTADRALASRRLRDALRIQVIPPATRSLRGLGAGLGGVSRVADTFVSLANTVQTRLDTSGPVGGFGRASLKVQVDRALTQVLGSSVGRSGGDVGRAVDEVFPAPGGSPGYSGDGGPGGAGSWSTWSSPGGYGQSLAPAAGLVSTYRRNGDGNGQPTAGFAGDPAVGAVSPEQAALSRQARLVVTDALPILQALQPRSADIDPAQVATLRSQVETELNGLVAEFDRLDGPRIPRVEVYLDALIGPEPRTAGHIVDFADLIRRDPSPGFSSLDEERQDASLTLLTGYARGLATFWEAYLATVGLDTSTSGTDLAFAERLSRASLLLPAVGETTGNLMAAMDAIGFSENERRLDPIEVSALAFASPAKLIASPSPSRITVGDLTAWLDEYSRRGGQYIEQSGQFGLDFVASQADVLFDIVGTLIGPRAATAPLPSALDDERVRQELENLFNELGQLADLAA